jgi:hypothetical protein
MKGRKFFAVMLFMSGAIISVVKAGSLDPIWLFKSLDPDSLLYSEIQVYDTCRTDFLMHLIPTDTGDAFDGEYINLDYKFTADSIYFRDKFDSNIIKFRDKRPGYAGFKIDWDGGMFTVPLTKYKYLIFAHKGPLPNHKVTINYGYNTTCGSPTVFQTVGTVAASSTWKVDTIVVPESIRNIKDSLKDVYNYYELQVIINNADPSSTQMTSGPGNFKMDNICVAGREKAAVINRKTIGIRSSDNAFVPTVSAPVQVSAFSLNGELLFNSSINVVAGRSYSVGSFVKKHLPMSTTGIKCIKIKGAGVDILQRVW